MKATQQFFDLLWQGNVKPADIHVQLITGSLLRTEESEQWIEDRWNMLIANGMKPWPNDRKPSRFRLVGLHEDKHALTITLDPCVSYRDFAGSCVPEFIAEFGPEHNPDPLAVSVVIVAPDTHGADHVLLTVRKNVDYKRGGYHASIGGFMDLKHDSDPVATAYREMKEEVGIKPGEIAELRCIGAAYNPNEGSLHTDLIFTARTHVEIEEIVHRKNDGENEGFVYIPATRAAIEEWMVPTTHANVIIAMVGLLLFGKSLPDITNETGDEWYRRLMSTLAHESRDYGSAKTRHQLEERDLKRFEEMVKRWRATRGA